MHRNRRRDSIKKSYDRSTRRMKELKIGQQVYYKRQPNLPWEKGTIREQEGVRSYIVEGNNGVYWRNGIHLREDRVMKVTDMTNDAQDPHKKDTSLEETKCQDTVQKSA